jgi:hypothetical protein
VGDAGEFEVASSLASEDPREVVVLARPPAVEDDVDVQRVWE